MPEEEEKEAQENTEEKRQRIDAEEQELRDLNLKIARHTVFAGTQYQWEDTDRHTAAAAITTREIQIPYDDSKVYVVTSVAAVNDTTTTQTIKLYSKKAGELHLLRSNKTSNIAESVDWSGHMITGPNQSMVAIFNIPQASDKLVFTVMGYWTNKGKLP